MTFPSGFKAVGTQTCSPAYSHPMRGAYQLKREGRVTRITANVALINLFLMRGKAGVWRPGGTAAQNKSD